MSERPVNEIWNYQQIELGFNYRINDIQAALGLNQMKRLDEYVERRHHIAKIYDEEKNIVELADNTKINIENTNILVDRGVIDYKNDKLEVFGNFYLYQDLNILSGKDLKGNTSINIFSAIDLSYIYINDL